MNNNNSQLARINFSQNSFLCSSNLLKVLDNIDSNTKLLYNLFVDHGILQSAEVYPPFRVISNKILEKRSVSNKLIQI